MTEPLFVLSTFKVKEGRVDDVKKHYRRILDIIEPNEPQLIAFHGFLSEDETEMTSIQVHPDTDSMEFHMQVLKDNWDALFSEYGEMLEGIRIEYYGTPPQSALWSRRCRAGNRRGALGDASTSSRSSAHTNPMAGLSPLRTATPVSVPRGDWF